MNRRQVAHVWAQQTKTSGGRGTNLYFEGTTIFSYGSHFPIARFVTPRVVLFTSQGYSSTTSQHKSFVRQALGSQRVHVVPNVMANTKAEHQANFVALRETVEHCLLALSGRRDKSTAINSIRSLAESANAYAVEFRLRGRVKLSADLLAAAKEAAEAVKRREALAKRRDAKMRAEHVQKWLAGEIPHLCFRHDKTLLRIKGDIVETSMGAEFPASHCARVWKFINRVKARGQTWQKNGEACPIGLFQIDEIDATGNVKAGCHNVEFSEIDRLAELLGLKA